MASVDSRLQLIRDTLSQLADVVGFPQHAHSIVYYNGQAVNRFDVWDAPEGETPRSNAHCLIDWDLEKASTHKYLQTKILELCTSCAEGAKWAGAGNWSEPLENFKRLAETS